MSLWDKQRPWAIAFMTLIAATVFVLSYPGLLIEVPAITYRVLLPALLVVGLVGSGLDIGVLRILGRVIGWVAIFCLLPIVFFATPDLDHADPLLRGFPTVWRLGVTLALCVALIMCFKKLALKSR